MKHIDSMKMLIAAILAEPSAAKTFVSQPLAQQLARFGMAAIQGLDELEAEAREMGSPAELDTIMRLRARLEASRG